MVGFKILTDCLTDETLAFVDENADLEVMGTNQTAIAIGFQKYK